MNRQLPPPSEDRSLPNDGATADRFAQLDVGAAYRGVRERLTALLGDLDQAGWERTVPHCPNWTVRQTLSHLVGVVDDAVNGNMAGVATDAWTKAQVDKRIGIPGAQLLDDWNTYGPLMEHRLSELGLQIAQAVFDVVTHEHDLRHAVGSPGARDSDAVWVAIHFVRTRIASQIDATLILDGLEVLTGASSNPLVFTGSAFDALRVFSSRRSPEEIRSLDWNRDPAAVLNAVPFGTPQQSLHE